MGDKERTFPQPGQLSKEANVETCKMCTDGVVLTRLVKIWGLCGKILRKG